VTVAPAAEEFCGGWNASMTLTVVWEDTLVGAALLPNTAWDPVDMSSLTED
jgi:hypothetical protein